MAQSPDDSDVIPKDHGPWLYMIAPVSFALLLGVIVWLSAISF
jgi:hypothetical protein